MHLYALYYIFPSHSLLSHLLLVPYNLTVKEGTYIHMKKMNKKNVSVLSLIKNVALNMLL